MTWSTEKRPGPLRPSKKAPLCVVWSVCAVLVPASSGEMGIIAMAALETCAGVFKTAFVRVFRVFDDVFRSVEDV